MCYLAMFDTGNSPNVDTELAEVLLLVYVILRVLESVKQPKLLLPA